MSQIKYKTEPLQCITMVHYNTEGELDCVSVVVNGNERVTRYPEHGDSVGDVFEEAFEDAKTQMLTRRVVCEEKAQP